MKIKQNVISRSLHQVLEFVLSNVFEIHPYLWGNDKTLTDK